MRVRPGRMRQVKIDVIGDEQIQVTVAVVVEEGTSRTEANAGVQEPGLFRQVREGSVAVIPEKPILSVVSDKQVFKTIVVVVANADPVRPARRGDSGLGGDIG